MRVPHTNHTWRFDGLVCRDCASVKHDFSVGMTKCSHALAMLSFFKQGAAGSAGDRVDRVSRFFGLGQIVFAWPSQEIYLK